MHYHALPAAAGSLDALLNRFDTTWLVAHLDREVLRVALAEPARYQVPPHAAGAHVHAALASSGHRHRLPADICIQLIEGEVRLICSLCHYNVRNCAHAAPLLVDLVASAELRDALRRGDPSADVSRLPAARAAVRRDIFLLRDALPWDVTPIQGAALEITLAVHDGRDTDQYGPWEPSAPSLELRLRRRGERSMLGPDDVRRLSFPPGMRRLVALCRPLPRGRKGFGAEGTEASVLLELLRRRPLLLEGTSAPVGFAATTVRPVIARTRLPRCRTGPQVRLPKKIPDYVAPPPNAGPADLTEVDAFEARWLAADGSFEVPTGEAALFPGPHPYVWIPREATFYPLDPTVDPDAAQRLHDTPALEITEGRGADLYRLLRTRFRGRSITLPRPESLGLPPVEPPAITLRLDGQPLDLRASLEGEYAFGTVGLGAPLPPGDGGRDEETEDAACRRVRDAGLAWDDEAACFRAEGDGAVAFWREGIGTITADASPPVRVLAAEHLAGVRVGAPIRARLRLGAKGGWLDTAVSFESDEAAVEMAALREALRSKRRWVVLRDGRIAALDAMARSLAEEAEGVVDDAGLAHLPAHQLGLVERWAEIVPDAEIAADLGELRSRLRAVAVREEADLPAELQATLRPYQLQGVAWLQFLGDLGAGGVLADDMGLGKTLMTLTHLARRKEREGRAPALVVCPTSVAGNWAREAERFTPGLAVLLLTGPARAARFPAIAEHDLVITTYALLRRDVDALAAVPFRAAIFDEAQNLKNTDAATRRAAAKLDAAWRLALTGTPVENRLGELWSILDLVNPGMLGGERSFESRFERPILADPRGRAAAELRARIRPFLLRRSKRQVLDDLPPKEEIDLTCVPSPAQRRLYDLLAAVLREDVRKKIHAQGLAKSGIAVLTALLRLRQLCLDPRLVDETRHAVPSAKREAFLGLVRDLVAEGRRALVFSQFVGLLSLWRADLDREGIAYEYLDGSTTDRDAVVDRFQRGAAPLFLISLKAGGSGLNLTAADTVIHCDPWWNPAVEDQATDRAHRIGQNRAVTVYRLVLKGTIEDKIAQLKAKKREIADAVVRDDAGALRGLTEEDVAGLLGAAELVEADEEEAPPSSQPPAPEPAPRPALPPAPAPAGTDIYLEGMELSQLGDEVRAYLEATGTLQKTLAAQSGILQSRLSRLVNDKGVSFPAALAVKLRAVMAAKKE